ncbi:hypothetical protein [Pelovirga terrestris]|uniref:Uncharacterized protein n=1 Tax=Pelovirga terrestris TaxID=2771352 RepID=A0A8J6QNW9_9BACT|nr:hypothetical protein [Pelovirga terrestris]MBD1401257.1 hypothetical protein [Pelovirga terrestris]
MAQGSGWQLLNGDVQRISIFNLVALRASAEGPMTASRCGDLADSGSRVFWFPAGAGKQ